MTRIAPTTTTAITTTNEVGDGDAHNGYPKLEGRLILFVCKGDGFVGNAWGGRLLAQQLP